MKTLTEVYGDKVVIIAGGASGIGEQLAKQLHAFGAQVVVLDRNEKAGAKLAATLKGLDFFKVDLKNLDLLRRSFRQLAKQRGVIDYFFNCAGTFLAGEMRDTPIEDWHRITESNLHPMWNGTSVAYQTMLKQGRGHIINIASSAGLFPVPVMSIYGATKAAVVGMTLGLRTEARSLGINVSVICPTIVNTPLYDTALYAGVDRKKAIHILKTSKGIQMPDVAAARILKRVAKNKAIIHTSASTYSLWLLYRLSSELYRTAASRILSIYRKSFRITQ
jgi:NAD(P)-dependent dehydrogenase (short-subunit alcohol dehydrogenase family)